MMDVRERCRRTISFFQYEFEEGVKQLKKIKNMQDLEILQRADVIGMTTTGKHGCHIHFRLADLLAMHSSNLIR